MSVLQKKYDLDKLEIVFIIIVILGLVGAGFYAWNSGKKKENGINSFAECVAAGNPVMESYPEQCMANGQSFTNPNQEPLTEEPSTEPAESFSIPELGVKFGLTAELEGLYYYFNPENSVVYFSLEAFRGSDCAAEQISLAALSSSTETEVDEDVFLAARKDSMKLIGDKYYHAEGAQAACSEDAETQARAWAVRGELLSILPDSLETL